MSSVAAVRFDHVTKRFPGVLALDDVSFEVAPGTCHAVCGENGAGKSTLGKLLAGIHACDGGGVFIAGQPVSFASPAAAQRAGVGMVHQELAFAENMSVAENLCLAELPARSGWFDGHRTKARARAMLDALDPETSARIDVDRAMGSLTVGEQQLCQIAAAVGTGARILVFDEPTSSLSEHEAGRLERLIRQLKQSGVTMIYVSHRMPEIFRLCDAVTVLRDGRHVTTQPTASLDHAALVRAMIGRVIEDYVPKSWTLAQKRAAGPPAETPALLQVRDLASPGHFAGISFAVRAGEILGLSGLVGAGRSEILAALFGLDPTARGEVKVAGKAASLTCPDDAMALGIGLVPEDRKRQALVLGMSARANVTLPLLSRPRLSRFGFVRSAAETALAKASFQQLRVRAPDVDFVTAGLSGGNQQKLVLARWLNAGCRILLFDEPTRGIDVGAKSEIHDLIDELAAQGAAVVLVSSELPELIKLSHRILVLHEGVLQGEVSRELATEERILHLMSGSSVGGPSAGIASPEPPA
jgi:ABC-type sugar transport system ATPase subunit